MTPAAPSPIQVKPIEASSLPRSPWFWVPSLYFSQGIPYVIVMTMSVVMYKRLGISNTDIALYTSWLLLPWVIKPLWSPFVDITRTKRFWVVAMQFLICLGLGLVAFTVRGGFFFRWSLFLFWIMAFASATHDIAADGFYMLSLSKHEQAWWVGLRSTFYRAAMIVGSGLLVVLAGILESKNGLAPVSIPVRATANMNVAEAFSPGSVEAPEQPGEFRLIARPNHLDLSLERATSEASADVIAKARQWNLQHGFVQPPATVHKPDAPATGLFAAIGHAWSTIVTEPLGKFLSGHFPNRRIAEPPTAGNVGFLYFTLSRPPLVGENVVINLERKKSGLEYVGLAKGDKGFRLVEGERFEFTLRNWNQPAVAVVQLDPKLTQAAAVTLLVSSGNIPLAWQITLFSVAIIFLLFSCWHFMILPYPPNDGPVITHRNLGGEFLATLGSFFRKPGVGMALAFILLYRFDEAQLGKMISPFFLDGRAAGGLGLTTSQVGLAYGTFGILSLTCGGLLGGFLAARFGLKAMLPFMVCAMYIPKLVFVFLGFAQPENFLAICGVVGLEQLGYGFGFTAFMLYLLYFADGPHKTAHYAICTGFMALGMMVPGLWSGWLQDKIGYRHFFVWIICSALPGFLLALRLKVDPAFGKKAEPSK